MAFSAHLQDHNLEEMRYGHGQLQDTSKFPAYNVHTTPLRTSTDLSSHPTTPDARIQLQRRYTTDTMMSSLPGTWDNNRSRYNPAADSLDIGMAGQFTQDDSQKLQMMLQLKQQEFYRRQQEVSEAGAKVQLLELQKARAEEEMLLMAQDLDRMAVHSEPTTPPEFREGVFMRTKPTLSVASALATPPMTGSRVEQQQLITPPSEDVLAKLSQSNGKAAQSRRNSDETKGYAQAPIGGHRSARNSLSGHMHDRPQLSSRYGIGQGQVNAAEFLYDDESLGAKKGETKSPDVKQYLQMMDTKENFPILTSAPSSNYQVSSSSAALDLASSRRVDEQERQQSAWGTFQRSHRPAQHSLPSNGFPFTPNSSSSPKIVPQIDSPAAGRSFQRSHTEANFFPNTMFTSVSGEGYNSKLDHSEVTHAPVPKLQASFSTSDLPTMRNVNGIIPSTNFGRGPVDRQRHGRELPFGNDRAVNNGAQMSFGPPLPAHIATMTPPGISSLPSPSMYSGAYGHAGVPANVFHAAQYGPYPAVYQNKAPDGSQSGHGIQARNVPRRNHEGEANRFANTRLEDLVDQIYSLCKDQHGCRYLQKKLEESNPEYVEIIFRETHSHVVELMTDPFGNYLCQKLLEHANNDQRTILVNEAAPSLVTIALNQHGTRALQKMIDFLGTSEQIGTIVRALKDRVVPLIQDLNGNHVIQKCLNRLKPEDAQFIFDAVGDNCITVGTHRHGCCVLQRCIDHASGEQKHELIRQVTRHSLALVQDAFGNYVVQYILDLGEPTFSEPVIQQFRGKLCDLAKQKFSSNVIEKCIRVAEPATNKLLIEELIESGETEALLRDSYANYVIQTALDYSSVPVRERLVDSIGPFLPTVRSFPYGRRIASKITGSENKPSLSYQNGSPGGQMHNHSRSNSYSAGPRPIPVPGQVSMHPNPVQHPYPLPFGNEMGAQFGQ